MDRTTNRTAPDRPTPVAGSRRKLAAADEEGSQPKRAPLKRAPKRAYAVAPKRPTRSEPAKRP